MSLFDQFNWQGVQGSAQYWGYYWLGPVQIPPLPVWIGLTDRVTGVVYYFEIGIQTQHIKLSSTPLPSASPIKIYAPWDGPFLGQYGYRIGISNARLVLDQYPGESGPGPFVRSPSSSQLIAGMFATNVIVKTGYDHAAYMIGSATNSIFAAPKTSYFDQYNAGQGSDVIGS